MQRATRLKLVEVNPHLVCVLCKGYYVDATAIVECLHSFCRSCIIKYLENNSSSCPICGIQVHKAKPYRQLRPDKALQDIVYKLVPGLYLSEMRKRREFYSKHPELVHLATLEERGMAEDRIIYSPQDSISLSLEYSESDTPREDWDCLSTRSSESGGSEAEPVPHRRYLQCPAVVTMAHLKKFIRMKFGLSPEHKVDIIHKMACLPDEYTLMDVAYIYTWKRNGPMRFFYRIYDIPRPVKKPSDLDTTNETGCSDTSSNNPAKDSSSPVDSASGGVQEAACWKTDAEAENKNENLKKKSYKNPIPSTEPCAVASGRKPNQVGAKRRWSSTDVKETKLKPAKRQRSASDKGDRCLDKQVDFEKQGVVARLDADATNKVEETKVSVPNGNVDGAAAEAPSDKESSAEDKEAEKKGGEGKGLVNENDKEVGNLSSGEKSNDVKMTDDATKTDEKTLSTNLPPKPSKKSQTPTKPLAPPDDVYEFKDKSGPDELATSVDGKLPWEPNVRQSKTDHVSSAANPQSPIKTLCYSQSSSKPSTVVKDKTPPALLPIPVDKVSSSETTKNNSVSGLKGEPLHKRSQSLSSKDSFGALDLSGRPNRPILPAVSSCSRTQPRNNLTSSNSFLQASRSRSLARSNKPTKGQGTQTILSIAQNLARKQQQQQQKQQQIGGLTSPKSSTPSPVPPSFTAHARSLPLSPEYSRPSPAPTPSPSPAPLLFPCSEPGSPLAPLSPLSAMSPFSGSARTGPVRSPPPPLKIPAITSTKQRPSSLSSSSPSPSPPAENGLSGVRGGGKALPQSPRLQDLIAGAKPNQPVRHIANGPSLFIRQQLELQNRFLAEWHAHQQLTNSHQAPAFPNLPRDNDWFSNSSVKRLEDFMKSLNSMPLFPAAFNRK